MTELTERLKKLSKELAQDRSERANTFKMVKQAYYNATEEQRKTMREGWDELGL